MALSTTTNLPIVGSNGDPAQAIALVSLIGALDPEHFFHTLDRAVEAFRRQSDSDRAPAEEPLGSH